MRPEDVRRLERLLAGDPAVEDAVLAFITNNYGAKSLFTLPANIAAEIIRRPADFIRAAKRAKQPELEL
ncbi:MAG TPA: hypothetical protein VIU40_13030 [Geobacteraceae bacterium]